jgi:hypothetical protein
MTAVQAKIAMVDDLQARRISAAENRLRENLSTIESIEATIEIIDVEIIDVEMGKNSLYLTMGKTPLERVHTLLSKLYSIRVSQDRGSIVSDEAKAVLNNYVQQVESIFDNLLKPLMWRSFLMHDLTLLTDIPSKVQKASVKCNLNKAQTKALARLEQVSGKVFLDVIQKNTIPVKRRNDDLSQVPKLNEFSAREIQVFTEDLEKANNKTEAEKEGNDQKFRTEIKSALMTRLGIPLVRIARRLNIHRETISKYVQKNDSLFNEIRKDFNGGIGIPDIAQKHLVPGPLVWSVVLQEKTDRERFKALNWGLRTWDNWNFNDVDKRFGDNWPGRIPANVFKVF